MSWEEVSGLRKAGKLDEARALARQILARDPGDYKTRSQFEWVLFGLCKRVLSEVDPSKSGLTLTGRQTDQLVSFWDEYRELNPRVPDLACSQIVGQLTKVGHCLPNFANVVYWLRTDGLRDEDWKPNEFQGKTLPSLGNRIALALCRWIKAHPTSTTPEDVDLALEWIAQSRQSSPLDHQLWLDWNAAVLLRQKGDAKRAAELLSSVIKAKRNEFWVWAEAGRLYAGEQPDLALACFCRALECPAEAKFLVRAHRELAELLLTSEEYGQASREIAAAIEIRQAEGWSPGQDLEAFTREKWYDPCSPDSEERQKFYARHSSHALALCFDAVETRPATYLGLLRPHAPKDPRPGWKPRPLSRFAFLGVDGRSLTLVTPHVKSLKLTEGAAVSIVVGRQRGEEQLTVVHVAPRPSGAAWDCLEAGTGVITREESTEKLAKVLVSETGDETSVASADGASFSLGDGVRVLFARNPKNSRVEVFEVGPGPLPVQSVRRVAGGLRRNPAGFGFVEDVFVPPHLLEDLGPQIQSVSALAVYARHPKDDRRSWRAISIGASETDTGSCELSTAG